MTLPRIRILLAAMAASLTHLVTASAPPCAAAEPARLAGHWPLAQDARDLSGNNLHGEARGVEFITDDHPRGKREVARFDGVAASITIPYSPALPFDRSDFTFSLWLNADTETSDLPGSIASRFDLRNRRGFSLGLATNTGVTTSQANFRQLEFGIDNQQDEPAWTDHGRPGNAMLIFSLCVHQGELFAGTCESAADGAGHVFRFAGGHNWVDCGAPDRCNSVSALATFQGELYAGVSKYRLAGSALEESQNPNLGGKIYRYAGDQKWIDCGQIPSAEAIGGLVVFKDRLYASSLYRPAGFYRYEGEQTWSRCALPDGKRVEALCVWNGALYASSYDLGHVFQYDGAVWTDLGQVGDSVTTQTYSFAVHHGDLYVGTWAGGKVFRYDGGTRWIDCGRLGQELEVMGMLVHNGQLYAGSLPLAEVYRYGGDESWNRLVQLDTTPDVKYRRAWTMAQYQGRLFCGTLPSGKVWSFAAGACTTYDRELPPGWHHVAAVRSGKRLKLYVDGKAVSQSAEFDPAKYDLSAELPLTIGAGSGDLFRGRMRDVRIHRGALTADEVSRLAAE